MFDILLNDTCVGILEPRGRGIRFIYTSQTLDDDAVPPLSLALPKQAEPFPDSEAGPFFRNLLPEQAYRRLISAAAGLTPENDTALLGVIGGECPGAVSIWPAGTRPAQPPQYQTLSMDELNAYFAPGGRLILGNAVARGRLSLPGVEEKIALLQMSDGWRLPLNGAVTSHILKQPSADFIDLLENELFCMTLGATAGLKVAATSLAAPELRVFCTERFDRVMSDNTMPSPRRKLHQEDFCQILQTEPQRKYEFEGGPGLKRCAEIIRRHSALPAADLERLVRWVGFNYMIGNEDAHAKNLGLLYTDRGLHLTPHYDLLSTEVYPQLLRRLAMKIGGATDVRNVQRSDWERFATALKLPWPQARAWLLDTAEVARDALAQTMERCMSGYGEAPVYRTIGAIVTRRAERMQRDLAGR